MVAAKTGLAELALAGAPSSRADVREAERAACFHCGEPCPDERFHSGDRVFCCQGCRLVHDLLAENGLTQFYDLSRHPGVRVSRPRGTSSEPWACLDEPAVQQRLLDFTDGRSARVTFQIPAIHCVACVWLLENLFRLHPAIGHCQVNFPRREVAISYAAEKLKLSELVALLASIGYEPRLTLSELEKSRPDPTRKRRWLQLGVAGFGFGNIMLFSLPLYLGLDSLSGPLFRALFGFLSLALAVPVVVYSAEDYWRSALLSARQKRLTLDVPIALGLAALYAQSAFEILSGHGAGYLDSLTGLVFFLLCGRAFQQRTHERLAFDRDYTCFFPLSVRRRTARGEESVALSQLAVGDRLVLRHGELIPADARLVSGPALIDYSFVTGEAEPIRKAAGEYLYAGGKQLGGAIEIETMKPVSQSYLTSLWDHEAFHKSRADTLNNLTNRYSRRFTWIVVAVAVGAAAAWWCAGDWGRGLKAFTSVLIVACPCALALAAPFTLGSTQRWLARAGIFLKNTWVVERLAEVSAIVFDKTGTLTAAAAETVGFFDGRSAGSAGRSPGAERRGAAERAGGETVLTRTERAWVASLVRHSIHPHAVRIGAWLGGGDNPAAIAQFEEVAGAGLRGSIDGHELRLGSRRWLEAGGVGMGDLSLPPGSVAYLAIDGQYRGAFVLGNPLRPETDRLVRELGGAHPLALLSGDNPRERERFRRLFGTAAQLLFNQSPLDKLDFIRRLQSSGQVVMMVGDGLNDAAALKQSDVGVAVIEQAGAFSPASDIILEAGQVPRLARILSLARQSVTIVRVSFGISAAYNVVGVSIAAAGILSPVICAILMPLSSVSVVLFACAATRWAAKRLPLPAF